MTQPSQLYRLVEERLDVPLVEFVASRYPQMGWRKIAKELEQRTNISISYATLRLWFGNRIEVTIETRVAS